MLAVDIPKNHELRNTILLGLNVMNNWHYAVYKNQHKLLVDADPSNILDFVLHKDYPYRNSFDINGNYIFYQEGLEEVLPEEKNSIINKNSSISPTLSEDEIRYLKLMELYSRLEYKDTFTVAKGDWNLRGEGIDKAVLEELVRKKLIEKNKEVYLFKKG